MKKKIIIGGIFTFVWILASMVLDMVSISLGYDSLVRLVLMSTFLTVSGVVAGIVTNSFK